MKTLISTWHVTTPARKACPPLPGPVTLHKEIHGPRNRAEVRLPANGDTTAQRAIPNFGQRTVPVWLGTCDGWLFAGAGGNTWK
jgi:hypothetical protein